MSSNTGVLDEIRPFYKVSVNGKEIFEIDQRYQKLKYISAGAYGMVCSAEDTQLGRKVAIKKIRGTFRDLQDAKRILRELKLLRHLGGHENCIWILDVFVSPQIKNFSDVYIVTDLMDTDLYRIIESPQVLTEAHVKYFLYQLLRGMKYLHSAGVLHRDLKPQNILCNASCELVVADLGLARFIHHPDDDSGQTNEIGGDLTSYVVTRWYRAPELLVGYKNYGTAVDIWSIGCILAEMLLRKPFLPGRNYVDQLALTIKTLGTPSEADQQFITSTSARTAIASVGRIPPINWTQRFPRAPAMALDLLSKMLEFNPAKRISVEDALAHPFLRDYHAPDDEPTAPRIDPRDWEFDLDERERRAPPGQPGGLTKSEIQTLMLQEMAFFRPSAYRNRPNSARMAAHARATSHGEVPDVSGSNNTSSGGGSSNQTASNSSNGNSNNNNTSHASQNSGHTTNKDPPHKRPTDSYAQQLAQQRANAAATVASIVGESRPLPNYHSSAGSHPAGATAPHGTGSQNTSASLPRAALIAGTKKDSSVDDAVKTDSGGATRSTTDTLLLALLEQMKSLRTDILTAVDVKNSMLERSFEQKLEQHVAPLVARIKELEANQR